jgi:hypothetical protein
LNGSTHSIRENRVVLPHRCGFRVPSARQGF